MLSISTHKLFRKQYTTVNDVNRKELELSVGVTQGSVLEPLLYAHSLKF